MLVGFWGNLTNLQKKTKMICFCQKLSYICADI
jgi:hypothetical protein